MQKILYTLLLFPIVVIGQTSSENYIRTKTYKTETATSIVSPTITEANQSITYFDGLGRPIQQIAHKQSNSGKDIVTPIEYDVFGRQAKEFLPYANSSSSLNYNSSALTDVGAFYNTTAYENTANPFSLKELETSPLNRVLKQAAPGNSWAMANNQVIRFDYQTNTATDAVKLFSVSAIWNSTSNLYTIPTSLTTITNYDSNQLYKTITKNENWKSTDGSNNTVEEFKNKEGKIVLKRAYNNGVKHDTYYVYDQYGNLTFVLPPLVNTTNIITTTILDGLCYQYKYDQRNRLVEKKLPGKQWEFIVYDKLDRVVATGPALSPFTSPTGNGWMITKYDVFNRVVYTGWSQLNTINSDARKNLQSQYDAQTTNFSETKTATATNTIVSGVAIRYSNVAIPTSGYHILTVNYYDDYNFPDAPTSIPTDIEGQTVYYNTTIKPKGLLTGSYIRVLESSASYRSETNYTLYDVKARPIRSYKTNYLGGFTQVDTKIDFIGKTNYTITTHKKLNSSILLKIKDAYTYTLQDRLETHTHQINDGVVQLLTKNEYDDLGQLISKRVGGTDISGTSSLQKVDFVYNIRGWLKSINNVENLSQGSYPQDLFSFALSYDTVPYGSYNTTLLFNGNISESYWRTNSDNVLRKYSYQYDDLNRLKNALYKKPTLASPDTNSYNESVSYDKNGNILSLQRTGGYDDAVYNLTIDNLTYTYSTDNNNQLMKVSDASIDPNGFKDGVNTGDDYSYDANGNMKEDKNKDIVNINYNHLNLPVNIYFGDGNKIEYLYNAIGIKLSKTVKVGAVFTVTEYQDGFQYANNLLVFFPHAEGYVKNTMAGDLKNFNYVFNYTDHLGNVRLSYGLDGVNGLKIFEENNYYPFGLSHKNYNTDQRTYNKNGLGNVTVCSTCPTGYKYKYNGKELQDELGLNLYDYGARNYDPALGRWMNIDPLAEKYASLTPYDYVGGNPVIRIDPDGMDWYTDSDGNYHFNAGLNKDNAEQFFKDNNINNGTYKYASGNIRVGYNIGNEDEEILSNYTLNQDGSITDNMNNRNLNINETQSLGDTGKTIKAYEGETRMEQLDREVGEMNSFSRLLFNMFCYSDVSQTMALADLLDQNQAEGTSYGMYLTSQEGLIQSAMNGGDVIVGRNNSARNVPNPGTASTQSTMGGSQRPHVPIQTVTISGETKTVHTGPRGGKYYINNDGNKVNLNKDGTKK